MEEDGKPTTSFGEVIKSFFGLLFVLPMLAVPAQAAYEVVYWLREASWLNYDWYLLLGLTEGQVDLGPDLKGATSILRWAMNTWISLPFTIIASAFFSAFSD